MTEPTPESTPRLRPLPRFIFASRWLQLPLYVGLIAAQGVYVFLLSALAIALTDRLMSHSQRPHH